MTEVLSYVTQQGASAFMQFKRITKENIYSGKGWLKKLMEMESPSDGLVISETKDSYQSS